MPQEFQVLRCFKCNIFQVHPVKKGHNWGCKMCGDKQSIKKTYVVGTGKECRLHVQKLNTLQAECKEQGIENKSEKQSSDSSYSSLSTSGSEIRELSSDVTPRIGTRNSKWEKFIENEAEVDTKTNDSNVSIKAQEMLFGNVEIVLEVPQRRSNALAKLTNTKKKDKSIKDRNCSSRRIEMELSPNKFPESNQMRWEESASSEPLDAGFGNHIENGPKRYVQSIENRCTKAMKLQSDMSLPMCTLLDNPIKDIVFSKKKVFLEPKISSDSKWFKFINQNDEVTNKSFHDTDKNHNTSDFCSSKHDLYDEDSENYAKDVNDILDAPSYGSDQTHLLRSNTDSLIHSYKSDNINSESLFALADDEDLDSLLDF